MKVILTEKPSVACDIAKCLNINNKRDVEQHRMKLPGKKYLPCYRIIT